MLDCQLWGTKAAGHHLTNLILHGLATILLFTFLRASTDEPRLSAATVAIWAVHPLRAESVAWVSERKDVLSGVFFAATLLAYLHYTKKPGWKRMALVTLALAAGLMSKPMLVTTPLLLLVLDCFLFQRESVGWRWLLLEKTPLFLLSLGSCIATVLAQRLALGTPDNLPLGWRVSNALVSYVNYLRQMFWPTDLIPFYLHPEGTLQGWQVIGALLLILAISAIAITQWRRIPELAAGWFWYLLMLVPVIGVVQVGLQGRADRYTYLPQIGIIIAVVWGLRALIRRTLVLLLLFLVILSGLALCAYQQVGHWRNTEALWRYTLSKSPDNDVAHAGLAGIQLVRGETDEAIAHYRRALALRSGNAAAHYGLALALSRERKTDEAIDHWEKSLEILPDNNEARDYLGAALVSVGRPQEAVVQWQQALAFDPDDGNAANNLAWLLATSFDAGLRDPARAVAYARHATQLPGGDNAIAYRTLAAALAESRRFPDAVSAAEHALKLAQAQNNGPLIADLERCLGLFRSGRSLRDSAANR